MARFARSFDSSHMSGFGELALISGALQLTIPSYSLRLIRRFGTSRVGWFVVTAFASLALWYWLKPLRPMNAGPAPGITVEVVFTIIATLLLIGLCHLETLLSERQECECEERHRRVRWESRLEEETAALAQTNQALLRRVAQLQQDESALKQRQQELFDAKKQEITSRFAVGVAHHLNNALSVISGYTSLLLHGSRDQKTARHLQQISAAVGNAAGLSRQLLIASGQFAMRRELVGLGGLVANLEPLLRPLVGGAIVIQRYSEPNLPRILADVRLVEHIIISLVLNARDAMPRGGTVTISSDLAGPGGCPSEKQDSARPGDFVRLTVRDTGCGMTPDIEAHLFEPFFTTRVVGKGCGLGLVSVQGAVKQHAGRIEYATQSGVGTEFKVFLPVTPHSPAPTESDFRRWIRH
jgi:signal transduction histidine kinase